jgi:hypothetical protein
VADPVVIENVVLRGDDLKIVWSPWKALNRANNLRLLPIALGLIISGGVLGSRLDPGGADIVWVILPILLGWFAFIWVTNGVFLAGYKRAYALTPVGADPCTFEFDANGMRQVMPRGESSYRWSAFVEVVEDQSGFRLWMTPFTAIFLPSRYLDEARSAALRSLIEAARRRGDIKGP